MVQRVPRHLLATQISFPEREKNPDSQPAGAMGFNIGGIKFGNFLLDHQIAELKV